MAPIGERVEREMNYGAESNGDNGQNLWSTILGEVQSSSASKLSVSRSLLLLGENESGKTTLIARLQGNEDPKKGSGMEYVYINVKDEYRDDHTRLGCWILDGDLHHRGLLKFALTENTFAHTLAVIVVSMANPWNIMESLERWAEVLTTHIDRLKLSSNQRHLYRESLIRQFQEYTEPGEEGGGAASARRMGDANPLHPEDGAELLPLPENTLSNNLGLPIVVVVTKSDAISSLEKDNEYREEHFDFIQQHIRKFCLKYGAGLMYTSVKEGKNCDLLYRYLVHRVYGFPFTSPPLVVDRDAVFIPAGWDNEKKISILYENMSGMSPDDVYEDVIARPVTRKGVQREAEVNSEEEQVFLMKLQTQLSKQPPAPSPASHREASRGGAQKPSMSSPRTAGSPAGSASLSQATPKKMDGVKPTGTGGSEKVLANFFESLLSKKISGSGESPSASSGSPNNRQTVTRNASAELERLKHGRKAPLNSAADSPNSTGPS